MSSVRRSLAMSFAGRYAVLPVTLISYVVIARLLTPEEIGIYSVAAALIGLAQVFREFGTGSYLIQVKELEADHIRSAFGVSLFLGVALFVAFTAGAPLVGRFYSDQRIVSVVRIIAINFLLLPFGSISLSLLRREMQFGRVAIANSCAAVFGMITTVGLAWWGFGSSSLAWGAITTNAITGMAAWLLRSDRRLHLPGLRRWRSIVGFGGRSAFAAVVTSIAMDTNDLAVGRILGFTAVAMLSRAQGVMNLFHQQLMSAVQAVAYPAFARAHRDGENMEAHFVLSVTNLTVFAWPFYGMAALFPLEILRLAFGPQWTAASPLVPVFCAAGAIAATFSLINPWMLAAGRIDLVMRGELIVQPTRVALIVAAALIFRNLIACAAAFLVAFSIAMVVFYAIKSHSMKTDIRALGAGLCKSALVSLVSLAVPALVAFFFGLDRVEPLDTGIVVAACVVACAAWIAAVVAFKHPIAQEPAFRRVIVKPLLGR